MQVVCSSRDDKIGVGALLILTVNSQNDIQETVDTIFITDVSGKVYEVYEYMHDLTLISMMLLCDSDLASKVRNALRE